MRLRWPWARTIYLRLVLAGGGSVEIELWAACWTKSGNELTSLTWTSVSGQKLNYVRLDFIGALIQRPGRLRWRGF